MSNYERDNDNEQGNLQESSKKHGVSVKEVKRDMQEAVDEAYKNPTPLAQSVPSKGEKPTVDEVVDYVVKKVRLKRN